MWHYRSGLTAYPADSEYLSAPAFLSDPAFVSAPVHLSDLLFFLHLTNRTSCFLIMLMMVGEIVAHYICNLEMIAFM